MAALALTSCATSPTPIDATKAVATSYCRAAKPISWSRQDTTDTIVQIKAHNAAWTKVCGSSKE